MKENGIDSLMHLRELMGMRPVAFYLMLWYWKRQKRLSLAWRLHGISLFADGRVIDVKLLGRWRVGDYWIWDKGLDATRYPHLS